MPEDKLEKTRKANVCAECGEWLNIFLQDGETFVACKDWFRTSHAGMVRQGKYQELNIESRREVMTKELGTEKTTAVALPSSFEEVSGMAKAFVASGMFQDVKQFSQAIVKIQAGRELGLPPVFSMQNINMIRNRLTSSANTMAMLVKKSGHYNYRIKEQTDESCSITFFEREGDKWIEVGVSTFTMTDAKRAELVRPDSGWKKYPRAMLFSRAISQGARIYAPDAIGGIYTDEEMRSIPKGPADNRPMDTDTGKIIDSSATELPPEPDYPPELDYPPAGSGKELKPEPAPEPVQLDPPEEVAKEEAGKTPRPTRDPETVVKKQDLLDALTADFGMKPAEITKELTAAFPDGLPGTFGECYAKIVELRCGK